MAGPVASRKTNVDGGSVAPFRSNFDGIYDGHIIHPGHKPLAFILRYLSFVNILKPQGENSWKSECPADFWFPITC